MKRVLIFDCDGVLADTEQFGHLVAFNRMWREFGVPWQWSDDAYAAALRIAGGKERMAALFHDADFVAVCGPPPPPEVQAEMIVSWHKRKSSIYKEIVAFGQLPARPGVRRLAHEALAHGWTLAVASTSAPESVEAVLKHVMGPETAARFSLVLAGDVVKAKKPAPDIYLLAAQRLDALPRDCIVIEDSRNGLEAAHAAGMKCVITVSSFTRDEDFDKAELVLTDLGDPQEPFVVLANHGAAFPSGYLKIGDLDTILAG